MLMTTGSAPIDAERAFGQVARARRKDALRRRLHRRPAACPQLPVYDPAALGRPRATVPVGVREIPLDAIRGTLEPGRAQLFDSCFRPRAAAAERWRRVWLAEQRGAVLPPISVVPVDGGYVLRDGHHRVSVAKARGAVAIDASFERVG